MYKEFYCLNESPFRLSPDARFCFTHPSFARAQTCVERALRNGERLVLVTGQPGTGKTTFIDYLLAHPGPKPSHIVRLESTQAVADDLSRCIALALGLDAESLDPESLRQRLDFRTEDGSQTPEPPLLVIDEAQNLSMNALAELRLLIEPRRGQRTAAQVFLVGQESLRAKIDSSDLEQLKQRGDCVCRLEPLRLAETRDYLAHRLRYAGWLGDPAITAGAIEALQGATGGIPRLINKFADRLLLLGSDDESHRIEARHARRVVAELSRELLLAPAFGNPLANRAPKDSDSERIKDIAMDPDIRALAPFAASRTVPGGGTRGGSRFP